MEPNIHGSAIVEILGRRETGGKSEGLNRLQLQQALDGGRGVHDGNDELDVNLVDGHTFHLQLVDGEEAIVNTPQPVLAKGGFFRIITTQGPAGTGTIYFPNSFKWPGGTEGAVTGSADAVDIFEFYCDGVAWYGREFKNFA